MLKSPYEHVYLYDYDSKTFYRNDGNGEEFYSPVKHQWFSTHNEEVFFYRNHTVVVDPEIIPYLIQFLDTLTPGWGETYKDVDFMVEAYKLKEAKGKPVIMSPYDKYLSELIRNEYAAKHKFTPRERVILGLIYDGKPLTDAPFTIMRLDRHFYRRFKLDFETNRATNPNYYCDYKHVKGYIYG